MQVCVTKRGSTQNVPMDVDKVKANEYLSTLESVRRGGEYARPGSLLAVWMYNFRCRGGAGRQRHRRAERKKATLEEVEGG